jgi:hypothetical protein
MAKGQRALLPPEEEQHLRELTSTGTGAIRQRAQIVLDWHEGVTAAESAKRARLSENQVRYLLKLYRQKGLDLFIVDSEPVPGATPVVAPVVPEPEPINWATVASLVADHQVDMAHARHVTGLALTLFDSTMNVHRLPASLKPLLEAAALLHNVGLASDPDSHEERGRDIILGQPLRGFNDDERQTIAWAVAFHHKKVNAESDEAYDELSAEMRHDIMGLSAILRLADGLDNLSNQQTEISEVRVDSEEVLIVINGSSARDHAKYGQRKADLWNQVFSTRVRLLVMDTMPTLINAMPDLSPGLKPTMSVAKAGRAFAVHTLERIDVLLKQVQSGDLGLLPSLAREASRLAEAVVLADAKNFRKESHWFLESVQQALVVAALSERASVLSDDPAEPASRAVAKKLPEWSAQTQTAIQAIDSSRFAKMASELRIALIEEIDPNERALIAFHVGSILWSQLASLRDVMEHGTSVSDALDASRRLQDHLIAFRELLGREVGQVLDMLSPFEGYLSAIWMAQGIVGELEPKPVKKGRKTVTPPLDPASEALMATQMEALNSLADGLPATWSAVNSSIFRRAFALAVAAP